MAEAPAPQRPKTSIPRNPGRTELGMQAKLLFPTKEIVEQFYVPLGAGPAGDLPQGDRGGDQPRLDAAPDLERNRVRARLHHRARRVHVRPIGRVADAVPPARAASGGRRLRPAEPAL